MHSHLWVKNQNLLACITVNMRLYSSLHTIYYVCFLSEPLSTVRNLENSLQIIDLDRPTFDTLLCTNTNVDGPEYDRLICQLD